MTMNKFGMSVLTASILTTVVYATGTLTVEGGLVSASTEYLEVADADKNITKVLKYTCGMTLSSAAEAGFELKFPTGVIPSSDKNLTVKDSDTNETVALFDRIDENSIIFSAKSSTSISRNKSYKIVSDDNKSVPAGALNLVIAKGTTSVNAELIVSDNTGVNILDDVTATIIETKSQFAGSFGTNLDAKIDASEAFKSFTDGSTSSTTDNFTYTFSNDKDLNINATATKVEYIVFPDRNLSTYGVSLATTSSSSSDSVSGAWSNNDFTTTTVNDTNWTITDATDTNGSITEDLTATVAPTEAMGVVTFKASGTVTYTAGGVTGIKELFTDAKAGNWSIYGYNAQIPNVVGIAGVIDTTMKFTNRSSIDTNIYFTLIDPDGTVATLNSVTNTELATLAKGVTSTYKATDLLALITDPEFNKAGSFSLEVSIPTTPNLIYGMASFKNITLGQFKDLPIYNSSTLSY